MQRKNIAWRASQKDRLKKAVSNYNKKINKLIKLNPDLKEYLPEKVKSTIVKKEINTAKELNSFIKSLERLNKNKEIKLITNEQGVTLTNYEMREIKLKINKINRNRKKEIIEMNPSTEKGTMGSIKKNNLRPKNFNFNKMTKKDFEKFKQVLAKQSRSDFKDIQYKEYKENYLKAIKNNLGEIGDKLYELIDSKVSGEMLYKKYYDDPVLQLDFYYDPYEAKQKAEIIYEHWLNVLNEI